MRLVITSRERSKWAWCATPKRRGFKYYEAGETIFNKKAIGDSGEEQAARYLKKMKYKIIARNIRTIAGEIDIIALKDTIYVFVEVKYRSTDAYGMGFEAVDFKKQQKIRNSAVLYCQMNKIEALCRFDVISIDGNAITHIENAF